MRYPNLIVVHRTISAGLRNFRALGKNRKNPPKKYRYIFFFKLIYLYNLFIVINCFTRYKYKCAYIFKTKIIIY